MRILECTNCDWAGAPSDLANAVFDRLYQELDPRLPKEPVSVKDYVSCPNCEGTEFLVGTSENSQETNNAST